MSNSLRDQLIKAGVVSQEQADKAEAEQQAERDARRARRNNSGQEKRGGKRADGQGSSGKARTSRPQRGKGQGKGQGGGQRRSQSNARGKAAVDDDSPEAVKARAAAQALARDERAVKALIRAADGSEKSLRDELRRFIAAYDQRAKDPSDDDEPYHFAHNKKIKRMHLPLAQIDALSRGDLVIVNNDGRYALLPFGPACSVATVDQRRIVAAHLSTNPGDDDESPDGEALAAPDPD